MTGDRADIVSRLKGVLPSRWFPDTTPVLDAVMSGLAAGWASLYALLASVRLQTRIATATGGFLDGCSADFFGAKLSRRTAETDQAFRSRIHTALVQEHATRPALVAAITALTGSAPTIFEPARPADTGAYNTGALAFGAAGSWGSLSLPFQVFVTVRRPEPMGIATIAGYGTAGPLARASLSDAGGQVSDPDIYATVASVVPTASIAWTTITN